MKVLDKTYLKSQLKNFKDKVLDEEYLSLEGGNVTGLVDITRKTNSNNDLVLKVKKDGTNTNSVAMQVEGGHFLVGTPTVTAFQAMASERKCGSDNNRVNTAAFYVNSDGTAIFTHKGGIFGNTGVNNDAYMKFNQNGFKVAYSGTYNTAATEERTVLDSGNLKDDATFIALDSAKLDKDNIIVSETDIGSGAELETGKFYFVYED